MNNKKKNNLPTIMICIGVGLIGIGFALSLLLAPTRSVSTYINSAKKSAYIDTLSGYILSVMTRVNSAEEYQFFEEDTLYLIPVGKNKCISIDKGGDSIFSDTWKYFYVGVTYDGKSYDYYTLSLDGKDIGIDFSEMSALAKEGGNLVKSKGELKEVNLEDIYEDSNENLKYASKANGEYKLFSKVKGLSDIASVASRDKIVIVSSCKYSNS